MNRLHFARVLAFPALLLFPLLVVAEFVCVIIGSEQPPSAWFTALRFDMCELPCWVGIVPGETTLGEAEEHVKQAYSDPSLYIVEPGGNFGFWLTYSPTGYRIGIALHSDMNDPTARSIVRNIYFNFYPAHPAIADIGNALGRVEAIRISSGVEDVKLALFLRDQQIYTFVDRLPCDKVLVSQRIPYIQITSTPMNDLAWLSRLETWRGFGACHNLEIVLP